MKTKFKAFFLHLSLSIVVVSLIFACIIYFWFPVPFLAITNFKDVALILIAVDVVLGPLLTLVVFNPGKKSLRFDLSIIVVIQTMALSYGVYTMFLTHPVYITYFNGSYNIITAKQAMPEKAIVNNLKVSKLSPPIFTFMSVSDEDVLNQLFSEMMNGGAQIETRAEYYESHQDHLDRIISDGLDPETLLENNKSKEKLEAFFTKNGKAVDEYAFVPIVGSSKNDILILEKKSGQAIDILGIKPRLISKR